MDWRGGFAEVLVWLRHEVGTGGRTSASPVIFEADGFSGGRQAWRSATRSCSGCDPLSEMLYPRNVNYVSQKPHLPWLSRIP